MYGKVVAVHVITTDRSTFLIFLLWFLAMQYRVSRVLIERLHALPELQTHHCNGYLDTKFVYTIGLYLHIYKHYISKEEDHRMTGAR